MPALSAVYLDFADPASHRVWLWLSQLGERSSVEIRPYSLEREGDRRNPWDRTTPSWSVELLALGELARSSGRQVHERFVDVAFAAVHERAADLSSLEGWLAIGAAAGLDLDAYATDSDQWRAEAGLWHQEAEDDLGITGVPTLVFDGQRPLLVRLDHPPRDQAAARRLLADLADLACQPVEEVRRPG